MRDDTKKWYKSHFVRMQERCSEIGLKVSEKAAHRMATTMEMPENFIFSNLGHQISALESNIRWELEDVVFFHMPPQRANYHDCKELFGEPVNKIFPEIQFDMVEAGNCYSMGRGTACVFHLMRIMEVGVQRLGTKLGVALVNDKVWQNILDESNKAIKSLPKGSATVEMSQAAANLYAVKLAWRNEVMHPKDTYTLEEAENILRQVKLFMGQLA